MGALVQWFGAHPDTAHGSVLGKALVSLGIVYRTLLRTELALADHLEVVRLFAASSSPRLDDGLESYLCADHAVAGDWERAEVHARWAARLDRREDWSYGGARLWPLVESLLRSGDAPLARRLIAQFGELIGNNPRFQILRHHALGLLAQHGGAFDSAQQHFEEALTHATALGLPGERWQLLARQVRLSARRGDEQREATLHEDAVAVIHSLGDSSDDASLRQRFVHNALTRLDNARSV